MPTHTKLDAYLTNKKITNAEFAGRLQKRGFRATPSWISKIRSGSKEPGKTLARAIVAETGLAFDDLIATSPKRSAA